MLHFINTSGGGGGIDIFIVTARILSGVIIQYNNISVVLCCVAQLTRWYAKGVPVGRAFEITD